MKTYRAMMAEIERLQRKAEVLRRAELKGVIKHIRELIAKHGLTGPDLGLDGNRAPGAPRKFQDLLGAPSTRGRKAGKPAKAAASKGVARYRDPATGKTWTGRGKPPNWIVGAKDRAAFEIGAASAAGVEVAPVKKAAAKKRRAVKATRGAQAVVKAVRAAKAPGKVAAKSASAKRGAAKKVAAKKASKAPGPGKAVKAAKLPRPPVRKATRKKAKATMPAPATTENANGASPAPTAP